MENQAQPWYRRPEAVRNVGAILFFVALLIRSVGIQWGLPSSENTFSLHPDEPINFAVSQSISVGKGQLDPGFYNYGTLYLTCVSLAADVVRGYGGYDLTQPDSALAYSRQVHLVGRWLNSLAGAATALFIYLALVRRTGKLPALLAGMALAVAPGHVVHSRFMTVDVFAAALMAGGLYLALRLTEPRYTPRTPKQRLELLIGAATLVGLSAGTKYNGVLALIPLTALAMLSAPKKDWLRELAIMGGVVLSAFLVATPGALLNTAKFWTDFQYEVRHASTGHGLVFEGVGNGFGFTLFNIVIGFGALLSLLGVIGLVARARSKDHATLAVAGFGFLFFIMLGSAEIFFLRYTFPLYFCLAWGVGQLVYVVSARSTLRHIAVIATALGIAGVPIGGAITASTWTSHMVNQDIRVVAANLLKIMAKNEPELVVGVVSDPWFYTPTLYPLSSAPRSVPLPIRLQAMRSASQPAVVQFLGADPATRFDWDSRLISELKPKTIVISSFEAYDLGRLAKHSGTKRPEVQLLITRYQDFRAQLEQHYVLTFENPDSLEFIHDLAYIRPRISIWTRKPTP